MFESVDFTAREGQASDVSTAATQAAAAAAGPGGRRGRHWPLRGTARGGRRPSVRQTADVSSPTVEPGVR